MSRYTSRHTGATIDYAVDLAIGYGLGTTPKKITDWNDAKLCGWYCSDTGALNSPDSNMWFFGIVYNANNPEVFVQEVWHFPNVDRVFHWQRFYYPGTGNGTPWEWIDPPMYLGVEYRTTERYNGKPVYVKLIDFGALPNNTTKRVDPNITNFSKLVDMRIIIAVSDGSYHIQQSFGGDTPITINNRSWIKLSSGGIAIKTVIDQSADSAIVTLRYTKTTD